MSFTQYVAHLDITPGQAYAPFWSAFIQVLRSSMEHEARNPRGQSTLRVTTSVTSDWFTVAVENDNPQPDWDAVRSACEALGGSVTIESIEGSGTRISFVFRKHATAYRGHKGPAAVRRSGKHGSSAA